MKKTLALAAAAAASACSFAGVPGMAAVAATNATAKPVAAQAAPGNIVSVLSSKGNFKTLLKLVKQAGLVGALQDPLPITVVAPTDAAFARVPKTLLNSILSRPAVLREVLEYHVIPADANLSVLRNDIQIPTLTGYAIRLVKRGSLIRLDSAPVTRANVRASNGTIHVIDGVLLPPRFTGRKD